jgi:hypothetical protein
LTDISSSAVIGSALEMQGICPKLIMTTMAALL